MDKGVNTCLYMNAGTGVYVYMCVYLTVEGQKTLEFGFSGVVPFMEIRFLIGL